MSALITLLLFRKAAGNANWIDVAIGHPNLPFCRVTPDEWMDSVSFYHVILAAVLDG